MCDVIKADGVVCGKPVKVNGKCGLPTHAAKGNPLLAPVESGVDGLVPALAAANIMSTQELLAADDAANEEEVGDDEEEEAVPAAGAGTTPAKVAKKIKKVPTTAEKAMLEVFTTKAVAEMTPQEVSDTITYLRDYRTNVLASRAATQAKTREKNIKKGLTGAGREPVKPSVAAANRMAGQNRNSGSSEAVIASQMPLWIAHELNKHIAKCDGCVFPHIL